MRCWRHIAVVLGVLCAGAGVAGPKVSLDNILMSRINGVAMVQIWPACNMRYVDHIPTGAGIELRIQVDVNTECTELLEDVVSEAYLPAGGDMGNLTKVVFDALGPDEHYITLYFDVPSQFKIRQHAVGWIEIFVDTNIDSDTLPASVPPPLDLEPEAPPWTPVLAQERPERGSTQQRAQPPSVAPDPSREIKPSNSGDFVVQLGVFDSVDAAVAALNRTDTPHFAYTTDFTINGQDWHGLQVGFFETESDAEIVLGELRQTFPDSWVRYVNPAEASAARSRDELRIGLEDTVPAVRVSRTDNPPQEMGAWMSDGRTALLDRRYDDAISDYTRGLEYGDHDHRAQAREYIAVAHERNGEYERAIAEYEAYLAEFPSGVDADRVRTRLTSLQAVTISDPNEGALVARSESGGWQVYGGVSQYYWRNEEQVVHDGNRLVSGSGILALANFTASRRGERYDILARFNGGYDFNLVEYDDTGDTGWLSDAYVDVTDKELGLGAKIGRQTRRTDGVIGRFDGGAVSYQWKPDIAFSVSAGMPFDSSRYIANGDRFFYAASAQFDSVWDRFDVVAYTHQQTVDGISDRQAFGGEVSYRNGPLNVVSLVDFDASYNVLNTFLVNGIWQFENNWRVNGMVRVGAQPYLTTRNALAGQTAASIEELLETYTEGQIRTLARDRTAQSTTASIGLSIPLTERFDLSVDVSTRQAEATVASGGVAAIPETGSQIFFNTQLIASSLLKQGGLTILTLRHDDTLTRTSSMLMFDTRLPFGEALRINPRVAVTQQNVKSTNTDQLTVQPSIRVLYRWKRLLIDLEAGGRWASRELPPQEWDPFTTDGTEELTGAFVNLGYRMEF